MPHERRHYVRVEFEAPASLTTGSHSVSVQVLDLSLKGVLIAAPGAEVLGPGMLCHLTIPLTATDCHIAMSVEVAHVHGLHAGLLCHSMDLDSATHLRRLIELQLGDSRLLERDLAELLASHARHA